MTGPLQLRLAGYYDQQPRGDEAGDEPDMEERYYAYPTVHELVNFLLSREHRGCWFFAHAGGLADMQFVLDDLLAEIKEQLRGQGSRSQHDLLAEGRAAGRGRLGGDRGGRCWKIRASFSGSSAIIVHVSSGKNAWHFVRLVLAPARQAGQHRQGHRAQEGRHARGQGVDDRRFGRGIETSTTLSPTRRGRLLRGGAADDIDGLQPARLRDLVDGHRPVRGGDLSASAASSSRPSPRPPWASFGGLS